MARRALPPGLEGEEISAGEDKETGLWREGREPLRIFSVFRQVWIFLGFLLSSKKAALAGTTSVSSHQYR